MRSPRGTASGSRSIALALLPFPIPGSSSRPCRPPGTPRGPARGQARMDAVAWANGAGGAPTRRSARERPDRRPSPARHRSDRANRRRGCVRQRRPAEDVGRHDDGGPRQGLCDGARLWLHPHEAATRSSRRPLPARTSAVIGPRCIADRRAPIAPSRHPTSCGGLGDRRRAPKRFRGLVNAVLRKVSAAVTEGVSFLRSVPN